MGLVVIAMAMAWLVSGCGAATAPVAAAAPASADNQTGITVIGEGKVTAAPDMATINVGVATTGDTAKAAMDANAVKMTEVKNKLLALGVAEKDIRTSGLSVTPVYNNGNRVMPGVPGQVEQPPAITGYQANNNVVVVVNDLKQAATILDGVVSVGANSVSGLQFGLKDDSTLRQQALAEAVKQAQQKAKAMADAMGVKIGGIISAQEGSSVVPVKMSVPAAAMASDVATPISPGELTVTAQVQVTYSFQ